MLVGQPKGLYGGEAAQGERRVRGGFERKEWPGSPIGLVNTYPANVSVISSGKNYMRGQNTLYSGT